MRRILLILRNKIVIVIIIMFFIAAGLLMFLYLKNKKEDSIMQEKFNEVIIAKRDILPGETVVENIIEIQKIPESISSGKFVSNAEEIIGKEIDSDIKKGEIILTEKIKGYKENTEDYVFSSQIPVGLRAVTIPVNFYGDSKLVREGDRVDVVSVYYDDNNNELCSEIVLDSCEIILIDKKNIEDDIERNKSNTIFENSFYTESYSNDDIRFYLLTFFLDREKAKDVFLALDRGMLNISICPNGSSGL